ncbi:C39 family peptidase [Saccharopolyspora sp. NPDC002686]|uniref:C39 family peptidase n=1 Tax=Saccharopolyspora sp. NPDC002686 TaxID=3154541 RepID=UPI00332BF5F4
MQVRRVIRGWALTVVVGALVLAVVGCGPAQDEADVDFHEWSSGPDFQEGTAEGTAVDGDSVRIGDPHGTVLHPSPDGGEREYDFARWTSPVHPLDFGATQLVGSWNASTPPGTWVQVEMRGRTASGADTGWYVLGQWASGDADIKRTSVGGQSDTNGSVDVDTFTASPGAELSGYQLRVTLHRATGTSASPSVSLLGAMASAIPDRFEVPASGAGGAWGIELPVPRYSQNIHKGHFPQFGGGGEAWCSPTSAEMVVEYWGKRPSEQDLAWIGPNHPDPVVDHAARQTFDYAYDGTGNWSFNAAYAASYGLEARITRLRSLADAEQYIRSGIPLITSQSFRADELDGAGYGTEGHLMVIVGFTEDGDVIANDPASSDDAAVRNVYPRKQFENVWLRTKRYDADGKEAGGSGGIAYVINPAGFPDRPAL